MMEHVLVALERAFLGLSRKNEGRTNEGSDPRVKKYGSDYLANAAQRRAQLLSVVRSRLAGNRMRGDQDATA
jgi:hypothetical protein